MKNEGLWKEYAPTARGVDEHVEDLGLNVNDLRGKKILDIGSGLNQLANELKGEGLDIVSLDPFYALSRNERESVYERGYEDGPEKLKELLDKLESSNPASQLVAGRSETLPFADESFDFIISHYGSPFYAENTEQIEFFFLELSRVLKRGGESRIYPTWLKHSSIETNAALKNALANLKEKGLEIDQVGASWRIKKN